MKHFFEKYKKAIIFPCAAIGCLLIYLLFQSSDEQVSSNFQPISLVDPDQHSDFQQDQEIQSIEQSQQTTIMVDVKGAVNHPGVYTLTTGERVIDAIMKAGGYSQDADANKINHALKLSDEMVIYVPRIGEEVEGAEHHIATISPGATSIGGQANASKININTASETELTTLPGIGPSKAKAILEYREQNGRFRSIDDLKKISGIGDKTFEKLKDQITI